MKIINQYKNTKTERETADIPSLVLGNDLGNFFYLAGEETRYQGFYFVDDNNYEKRPNLYKVIDEIKILERDEIDEVKNSFFKVGRGSKDGIGEEYFLPDGHSSLCLKASKQIEAEVVLDCRTPYDGRQMGRSYELSLQGDVLVVKFTKRRDLSEDNLAGKKEFSLFLAVKTDKDRFEQQGEFFSKYYPKDQKRNSRPWDRFVYRAFRFTGKKAVFAVGKTKKEAVAEAEEVFGNYDKLYKKTRDEHSDLSLPEITDTEIKMAYLCAENSLRTLLVRNKNVGAYAGIPWFFQFWHRDEAVSIAQIYRLDKKAGEEIILSQLDAILETGAFPKQRFPESAQEVQSADSVGFLAAGCREIFAQQRVSKSFRSEVVKKFEKVVHLLLRDRTHDNLALNYAFETWMDSQERAGLRIEVQAGRLAIYSFLFAETGNDQYQLLLQDMEKEVKSHFFPADMLLDSPGEGTVRPNIFLAYHLYPQLLSPEEWEKCFDQALGELYLSWGGLATISLADKCFIAQDSGEGSPSYHNGDSWYFINNLVASALFRLNPAKYSEYINEIMEASTNDILYQGAAGHASEISSAASQQAQGCEAQLWSSATYLDFFDVALGG